MSDRPNWSRRAAIAACVGAPLVAAAALSGRARSALVGARAFTDSQAPRGGFPKTLRGPAGDERVLTRAPRRIASTYLAADEFLAALVDPARVVGVSAYVDDPATSNCRDAFPTIARLRSDPETIIALEPDLVCVAGFTAADRVAPAGGRGTVDRPLVALRFVRGRDGRDSPDGSRGRRGGPRRRAGGRNRGFARRSRTAPGGHAAACASSTTIRPPTRWAAARWWARS